MAKSTTMICGYVIHTLVGLNKEIFTEQDVRNALIEAGVTSSGTFSAYMRQDGYLTRGEFLDRCIGGWKLTKMSKTCVTIPVQVRPAPNTQEVRRAVKAATAKFGDIVRLGDLTENEAE